MGGSYVIRVVAASVKLVTWAAWVAFVAWVAWANLETAWGDRVAWEKLVTAWAEWVAWAASVKLNDLTHRFLRSGRKVESRALHVEAPRSGFVRILNI